MNKIIAKWTILWIVANIMSILIVILINGRLTHWFILGMTISGILAIVFADKEIKNATKTKR